MKRATGFTLVEMAIVLVIIGLLLGGLLMPLSTQIDNQRVADTNKLLEQAKEALVGFAVANGRLPCPASAASNGQESFAGGGSPANGLCSNYYDGFLPAAALGLAPTDSLGYGVDAWGLPQNRIRYVVYQGTMTGGTAGTNTLTATGQMRQATIANVAGTTPLISVCASATGITALNCGVATVLTSSAPFAVHSLGKNAATGGIGADEAANLDANRVLVSHSPTPATAPNGEFDDIVSWIPLNTLLNRMLSAGTLP